MLNLRDRIFSVTNDDFEQVALDVFRYQYAGVPVYKQFCDMLQRTPATVKHLEEIPFLPIEFFKSREVIQQGMKGLVVFESSGTTGFNPSKHYVADTGIYEESFLKGFELFYGAPGNYAILGLLPNYLERGNSSLVYMADKLIRLSVQNGSGFFLNEFERLNALLLQLQLRRQPTILLGVTFALLDFAERYKMNFAELIIMETGGMKGRREELTRAEVHNLLQSSFGVEHIHSEYGMTELLSQGYSAGNGIFKTPPWMRIYTRDIYDPMKLTFGAQTGAVNVVDLANLYSCSFIATADLARVNADNTFEILGRVDNAEVRGCNLMVV